MQHILNLLRKERGGGNGCQASKSLHLHLDILVLYNTCLDTIIKLSYRVSYMSFGPHVIVVVLGVTNIGTINGEKEATYHKIFILFSLQIMLTCGNEPHSKAKPIPNHIRAIPKPY